MQIRLGIDKMCAEILAQQILGDWTQDISDERIAAMTTDEIRAFLKDCGQHENLLHPAANWLASVHADKAFIDKVERELCTCGEEDE